jgi:arylsulfatase A-like enzyme
MSRNLIKLSIASLVLIGLAAAGWTWLKPGPEYKNTNVVFILLDTTRADKLTTYGYSRRNTSPNLDDFANKSTVFEMAISHSPWTKPSVASIFTSLTPREHGIFDWKMMLDEPLITLPEVLDEHGFVTQAHISHHAFRPKDTHFKQGFDVYDKSVLEKGSPHKVTSSKEITDRGIDFLSQSTEAPFFLWLHYFDPHQDYVRHKDFDFGKGKKSRYDSEIAYMDHHLGRLFEALEDGDHLENTIVVIVGDHGEGLGDHGVNKHTKALFQQQLHVPLIIYVPGDQGARVSQTVPLIDLAPTLTALLGLPAPEQFTGQAIPHAGGFEAPMHRVVYSETRRFADIRSVVKNSWKLIENQATGETMLYNIVEDPGERVNQVDADPERAAELMELLNSYKSAPEYTAPAQELAPDMKGALKSLGYME